jgi:hypothetical protein
MPKVGNMPLGFLTPTDDDAIWDALGIEPCAEEKDEHSDKKSENKADPET